MPNGLGAGKQNEKEQINVSLLHTSDNLVHNKLFVQTVASLISYNTLHVVLELVMAGVHFRYQDTLGEFKAEQGQCLNPALSTAISIPLALTIYLGLEATWSPIGHT